MAKRKVKIVRPGDKRTTWRGAGDEYRVLATGDDTAGDYFIMEAVVPPGGGPPLHIQTREEEAFYVLEGEVVFRADGERIVAGPGVYLNIPRDVPHHFENESDATVRMLIVFAPAKPLFEHSGFRNFFTTNYDVSANGKRFLVIETVGEQEEKPPAIRIVENWIEEHRAP